MLNMYICGHFLKMVVRKNLAMCVLFEWAHFFYGKHVNRPFSQLSSCTTKLWG